ncbi:MAG: carboxylating nicotinate-nucleotide diphosphorylase [Thermodesulfobacteriota bacterium]
MAPLLHIPPTPQVDRLIELALAEDIGHGDITTDSLDLHETRGQGRIVAKEPLVIAGLELIERVFRRLDPDISVRRHFSDGDVIETAGTEIAVVEGQMAALLTGERTALNFCQRMSGIATHVAAYVASLHNCSVRLVDTRKTVPGWRVLEKYAVRVGGACNHRMGLYDGVLIKDNHIAACGGIEKAVDRVRRQVSHLVRIEVEAATMAQVRAALSARVDVIMLDNMDDGEIAEALCLIGDKAKVEVSGRIEAQRLAKLAELGADIISVGALIHAARFVDLSMELRG